MTTLIQQAAERCEIIGLMIPGRLVMSSVSPPKHMPWKPWAAGGADAFRLDQFSFDPDRTITAVVMRTEDNRWEWVLLVGGRIALDGEHHRPGRCFAEAGDRWTVACMIDQRHAA